MYDDPRGQALQELARFVVTDSSLSETLSKVAELATSAIPAAALAGLSMLDTKGQPSTQVFTHPDSPAIDQAQYDSGLGPCLDAWRTGTVVRIDDTAGPAARPYPDFALAAKERGVASTLSLPLVAGGERVGALNLYSRQAGAFTSDDEALGVDLAAAMAVVVANSLAYWGALELSQQLNEAMASRAVIEQAKGIIMARQAGMTADEAFQVLKDASQRENVKLRDIAQRIIDGRANRPS